MANAVGNAHSSEHAFGWEADKAVAKAKVDVSEMVGCDPDELFFTSGAIPAAVVQAVARAVVPLMPILMMKFRFKDVSLLKDCRA